MGSSQDAQDLGISIELLPLSRQDDEFNVSLFYAVCMHLHLDFFYKHPLVLSFNMAQPCKFTGLTWTGRGGTYSI